MDDRRAKLRGKELCKYPKFRSRHLPRDANDCRDTPMSLEA